MRLEIFSDIHGDWKALERALAVEADCYIGAGDQVSWRRNLDRCGEILRTRAGRVWLLPGNHETVRDIEELCARYGLNSLHGRFFLAGRWHVAGLGYSNPTPFDTPGEYSEKEIAERLAPFAALDPLVMVCHAPPYGTPLDQIRPGVHAGSRSVREFVEQRRPAWFFCGHIHEAEGAEAELGATRAINVGKRGYLLELE